MFGSAAVEDNDFVTKQQTVKNIVQTTNTSIVGISDLPAYFIRYTYNGISAATVEIPASGTMDGQEILFMNTCNFNLEVNITGGTNSIYLPVGMTNKISCSSGSSIKLIWNGSVWYFKD